MAKKKKQAVQTVDFALNQAEPVYQPITETLEKNYMPYAMSVILARSIPEIDGFKPAQRKLLYTMYKMGLLNGARTKSANIVGQTMHLNPHGDSSIYEAMVRLTRGNDALLHPFVDSKGSFGKRYSKDMAYAASRYTEAKLDTFCQELFTGLEKNAVDFVPNYDNTTTEPSLLPTTFPNILVSPNLGVAVGLASNICSFNLGEVCDATVALLKNADTSVDRILDIMKAPDFSGGAEILYDRDAMREVYETGNGKIRMRARYEIHEDDHSIDILEIPYDTYIEVIIDQATKMIKSGKLKEVTDVRDAIDLNGFKLTFELRRDADPKVVIQKLFAGTDLESNFNCNFNVLIDGNTRTLGVIGILREWIRFRKQCLSRELAFDLKKKEDKLHLLLGLASILLDIDKAIRIIRGTEKDEDVVPNLAAGFNLTTVQAEYIAEIKLRNLNREYIIHRVNEIDQLQKDIENLRGILRDDLKLKDLIISQLKNVKAKFGKPRKTAIIGAEAIEKPAEDIFFENYNCHLVLTHDGYFKKISVQSAHATDETKLKEQDYVIWEADTDNRSEMLFFTDAGQMYRIRVSDFDLIKASQMGDYIPAYAGMDDGEKVIGCTVIYDIVPEDHMIFLFENGKGVRVPMEAYVTKTRRKKTANAFSSSSKPIGAYYEKAGKPFPIFIASSKEKGLLIASDQIPEKATRTAGGVQIMDLPKKATAVFSTDRIALLGEKAYKCKKNSLPSSGVSYGILELKLPFTT